MELRIDQKIAKASFIFMIFHILMSLMWYPFIFLVQILQETGVGVVDVFLFPDGSWKVAEVHKENSDRHTVDAIQQTRDIVQPDSSSHVVDLISGNDDDVPMNWSSASEDTKPVLNSQDLSMPDFHRNGPVRTAPMSTNMVSTSPQTLLVSSSSGLVSS
jgi:E3 SUMO-protein ligase PIAS1